MADATGRILRNTHVKCSSPAYVVEKLDDVMSVLGYLRVREGGQVPGATDRVEDFLVSMLSGGWVSIYNDEFYLKEEIARRLSEALASQSFFLWAEEEASWGYSFYLNGQLVDEFCSGIDELYTALFDSLPTAAERQKLTGDPTKLIETFRLREVTPDILYKLFNADRRLAKGAMVKFAGYFGIQTAGRTYQSIWSLPDEEKFGRERFTTVRYVQMSTAAASEDAGKAQADEDAEVVAVP